jgi:hypothetical protein
MRSSDGKHFEEVVGVIDRNPETGEEFAANHLDCKRVWMASFLSMLV